MINQYVYSVLQTPELITKSLSNKLSEKQVLKILENRPSKKYIHSLFESFYSIFVFFCIANIIRFGVYLEDYKIKFNQILKITFLGGFIFVVSDLLKITWFSFFYDAKTLKELSYFIPLSILNIFDVEVLKLWQIHLFKYINIFDILFFVWLTKSFDFYSQNERDNKTIKILSSTYLVSLLIITLFKVWISLYGNN